MLETTPRYPYGERTAARAPQEDRTPMNQVVMALNNAIKELDARIDNLHHRLDPVILVTPTATPQPQGTPTDVALSALESALFHLTEQVDTMTRRLEVIVGQLRI